MRDAERPGLTGNALEELFDGLRKAGFPAPVSYPTKTDDVPAPPDRIGSFPCERAIVEQPLELECLTAAQVEALATVMLDDEGVWPWDEEKRSVLNGLEFCGMELLGCYHPFHAGDSAWGICLFVDRIGALGAELAAGSAVPKPLMQGALLFAVLRHEWHHYVEEVALSHLEVVARRPDYQAAAAFYRNNWPDGTLNEALANARCLQETVAHVKRTRVASAHKQIQQELAAMMSRQRPAYSLFGDFLDTRSYRSGIAMWMRDAVGRNDAEQLVIIFEAARLRHRSRKVVPVRLVRTVPVEDDLGSFKVADFPQEW
jgi:hypothetical protein